MNEEEVTRASRLLSSRRELLRLERELSDYDQVGLYVIDADHRIQPRVPDGLARSLVTIARALVEAELSSLGVSYSPPEESTDD